MKTVTLPSGERVPALGLGTWHMGERAGDKAREIAALRAGIDLGMTLVDTAEMYAEGGAEQVVGEAIAGRRDQIFLVSKVYPHNASRGGVVAACERSLKRLATDRIDLYLLHWRGNYPLSETLAGFQALQRAGKIRHWGVSNFDIDDMAELWALDGGDACKTNQVLYHPGERGIEWSLLPESSARAMPTMAYSPLGQGAILDNPTLSAIADRHGVTTAAVALAWTMRSGSVISIPKSASVDRVRQNAQGASLTLTAQDLEEIDVAFPPPRRYRRLAML